MNEPPGFTSPIETASRAPSTLMVALALAALAAIGAVAAQEVFRLTGEAIPLPVRFLAAAIAACWFVRWQVAALRCAAPAGESNRRRGAALLSGVLGGTALLLALYWVWYYLLRIAGYVWLQIEFSTESLLPRFIVELAVIEVLALRLLTTQWATGHPAGTKSLSPAIAWIAVAGFGLTGYVMLGFMWMPYLGRALRWMQEVGLGALVDGALVIAFYHLCFWQEDRKRFAAMSAAPAENPAPPEQIDE